jgi:hypothetical protein
MLLAMHENLDTAPEPTYENDPPVEEDHPAVDPKAVPSVNHDLKLDNRVLERRIKDLNESLKKAHKEKKLALKRADTENKALRIFLGKRIKENTCYLS